MIPLTSFTTSYIPKTSSCKRSQDATALRSNLLCFYLMQNSRLPLLEFDFEFETLSIVVIHISFLGCTGPSLKSHFRCNSSHLKHHFPSIWTYSRAYGQNSYGSTLPGAARCACRYLHRLERTFLIQVSKTSHSDSRTY